MFIDFKAFIECYSSLPNNSLNEQRGTLINKCTVIMFSNEGSTFGVRGGSFCLVTVTVVVVFGLLVVATVTVVVVGGVPVTGCLVGVSTVPGIDRNLTACAVQTMISK